MHLIALFMAQRKQKYIPSQVRKPFASTGSLIKISSPFSPWISNHWLFSPSQLLPCVPIWDHNLSYACLQWLYASYHLPRISPKMIQLVGCPPGYRPGLLFAQLQLDNAMLLHQDPKSHCLTASWEVPSQEDCNGSRRWLVSIFSGQLGISISKVRLGVCHGWQLM